MAQNAIKKAQNVPVIAEEQRKMAHQGKPLERYVKKWRAFAESGERTDRTGMPDTDRKAQAGSPIGWAEKLVILAGGPAVSLAYSLVQPILPSIEADLAHGPGGALLVKMLVGVMGAAMVIGALLTGFFADRFGLSRVLAANYALYALAGTAGFYLDDLQALVVSRFLLGIAAAGAVTGSIIVINASMPPIQRIAWLGYYNGVAQISSVALAPVSGILGEFNWHWSFALYGLAAPFAFIAAFRLGRIDSPAKGQDETKGPPLHKWFPFRFAILGLLFGIIVYIPAIYIPFRLRDLGVVRPSLISLVLTADVIAGAIAALSYGRARRRLSERGAFLTSLLCAAIGMLVVAVSDGVAFIIAGSVMHSIGVAWFLPNLLATVANCVSSSQQGRAAGLIKSANYLGSPVAVLSAEPVARHYGPAGAIMVAALLSASLLITILLNLSRWRRPAHGVAT